MRGNKQNVIMKSTALGVIRNFLFQFAVVYDFLQFSDIFRPRPYYIQKFYTPVFYLLTLGTWIYSQKVADFNQFLESLVDVGILSLCFRTELFYYPACAPNLKTTKHVTSPI